MLDRFLQGQDLMEEGALKDRFEQAELLLGGHLPPFLQFGLETLHRLQGTLGVCEPSHISVTVPGREQARTQREEGVGDTEIY